MLDPPDLDLLNVTDPDQLFDVGEDQALRQGLTDILDQRAAARALFDKSAWILDGVADLLTPGPPPKLEDLLATFQTEDEYANAKGAIVWGGIRDAAADAQATLTGQDPVVAGQGLADPNPVVDAAAQAAAATAGAVASASASIVDKLQVPKDAVHVSDSATLFKDWHIKNFPTTPWEAPYFLDITDPSIVANVKKARSMLLVVPHGEPGVKKPQKAGVMAWIEFENGKKREGWMYVEGRGDYQDYFWGRVRAHYDDAKADADAKTAGDPAIAGSPSAVATARAAQRTVSACHATFRQEGLCPAINTYDGTVLTWCSGLAAPGALNKIFLAMNADSNCRKVMYLCGFMFTGTEADGEFQIVDVLRDPPTVWHRSNFASEDYVNPDNGNADPYRKKGMRDYKAFTVLEQATKQIELIYMLIALSRDALTRDKVFDPNFVAMAGMCTVGNAEMIFTEALYVFIAEVQHNWALTRRTIATPLTKEKPQRPSLVRWAIDHMTDDEKQIPRPSVEGDRAIAKGIFRFTLRCIQEDALTAAQAILKVKLRQQKVDRLPEGDCRLSERQTLYGLNRLIDNYWTPMQTGTGPAKFTPHSIDGSTLDVSGFPVALGSPGGADPNDQVVQDRAPGTTSGYGTGSTVGAAMASYSIGPKAQCDFLCPNDVSVLGFDTNGNLIVKDRVTGGEYTLHQDGQTREWTRVT